MADIHIQRKSRRMWLWVVLLIIGAAVIWWAVAYVRNSSVERQLAPTTPPATAPQPAPSATQTPETPQPTVQGPEAPASPTSASPQTSQAPADGSTSPTTREVPAAPESAEAPSAASASPSASSVTAQAPSVAGPKAHAPAVDDFVRFAQQTPAAETAAEYTSSGIRKLEAVLNSMAAEGHGGDAQIEEKRAALRQSSERLRASAEPAEQAALTRDAFNSAVELMAAIQQKDHPNLDSELVQVRQSAQSIEAEKALTEQKERVQEFFQRASDALRAMA
jgi:hypothetical protein